MRSTIKNITPQKPSPEGGLVGLYGLPNCEGTQAVTKWLKEKGFEILLHNYKTGGISEEKLAEWSRRLGWEKLLNKRSTTWRILSKQQQDNVVDETTAIKTMIENTTLIKRPVIEYGKELLVGFDEKLLAKTFG